MAAAPSLNVDRVRSESLEHLTQGPEMPSCTWMHKRGTGTSDLELRERTQDQADGLWCGQLPQQNKFFDAKCQEFTCKGIGLAVANTYAHWSKRAVIRGSMHGKGVCHPLPLDGASSSYWGCKVGPRAADTSHSLSLHKNLPTQAAIFLVQPITPRTCLSPHYSSPCFHVPCTRHGAHPPPLGSYRQCRVEQSICLLDFWPLFEAATIQYVSPYAWTFLQFFHLFLGNVKEFNDLFWGY